MSECFITMFSCCRCYITRDEMRECTDLEHIEHRRRENFYAHLKAIPATEQTSPDLIRTKGICKETALTELKYLEIPEALPADVFHDLDRGLGQDLFDEAIQKLIQYGKIDLPTITERIKSFDFGPIDINLRPSSIKHLSGLQIRQVLYRFNFIFHDTAPRKFFEATSLMSKILQIVYSNSVTESQIQLLKTFIFRLLNLWKSIFGQHLKPKGHNLLHYPEIIRKTGPLSLCETTAFERKHRFFTRVAEKNAQFTNILKSCSERHQMWWANEWKKGKMHDFTYTGPEQKRVSVENCSLIPESINWTEEVTVVKSAHYIFLYSKGLCVTVSNQRGYRFFLIENVIIEARAEKIYLRCKPLLTEYDNFFAAHKIQNVEDSFVILAVEELELKETFSIIKPYKTSTEFILTKRNVN